MFAELSNWREKARKPTKCGSRDSLLTKDAETPCLFNVVESLVLVLCLLTFLNREDLFCEGFCRLEWSQMISWYRNGELWLSGEDCEFYGFFWVGHSSELVDAWSSSFFNVIVAIISMFQTFDAMWLDLVIVAFLWYKHSIKATLSVNKMQ